MGSFNILSFELVVFALSLFSLVKLRAHFVTSIGIVEGLVTYVPP